MGLHTNEELHLGNMMLDNYEYRDVVSRALAMQANDKIDLDILISIHAPVWGTAEHIAPLVASLVLTSPKYPTSLSIVDNWTSI